MTALLTLVRSVLLHWKSVEREQLNWQLGHDCFMEKQMSMDYADEDSQQVYNLYNFIQQSESFCSGGNPNAVALLDSVSVAVFRILGGAVLSVGNSFFRNRIQVASSHARRGNPASRIFSALSGGNLDFSIQVPRRSE